MKKQQYAPSSAEEERFLREYNPSKYPKAGFAVDVNLFAYDEEAGKLWVLLIERGGYPYKGCYAFPGGFMDMDETAAVSYTHLDVYKRQILRSAET